MSDAQKNATDAPAKHGWQTGIAIAIAALLLVFLVLPGFIAGIWSRIAQRAVLFHFVDGSTASKGEEMVFYPAGRIMIMTNSRMVIKFYWWEYRLAGGISELPYADNMMNQL